MLRSGAPPRVPRPPLASSQPHWLLAHYGLQGELAHLLDQDEDMIAATAQARKAM
jgi:hypothetical protein